MTEGGSSAQDGRTAASAQVVSAQAAASPVSTRPLGRARALLLGATEHLGVQFVRYLFVGGIATVADFGTLILLTGGLGLHYLAGNAAGFTVGLTVNYLLSIVWVFSTRSLSSRSAEFLLFGIIGIAGLGISQGVMYIGVGLVGVHYTLAKVAAVAATLVWNFTVRRIALFSRPREARPVS